MPSGARWLVTGAAGFIGSHLVEALLRNGQQVRAVDNFATGKRANIEEVRASVGAEASSRLEFLEASVCDMAACESMVRGVDFVLHQAALGSVPRSIADPIRTFEANAAGFVKLLTAAKDAPVRRFVYASSSSVYGDHPALPKIEGQEGSLLSPYAATKAANELFANVYTRAYGMTCVGLRYFNVFGRRQDPDGAYAAVIPRWTASMLEGKMVQINGDGQTSRDFCHVDNAVQANLRAALSPALPSAHSVFNVAAGKQTTLLELFTTIRQALLKVKPNLPDTEVVFAPYRDGDIRHSLADISAASTFLGYAPARGVPDGLEEAIGWYLHRAGSILSSAN